MHRGRGGRKPLPRNVQISKSLSYILRHGAEKEGFQITAGGYVKVDHLLNSRKFKDTSLTEIRGVVDTNDKKRFELKTLTDEEGTDGAGLYIRAVQGHSITSVEDEALLELITDPASVKSCVHGTYSKVWKAISQTGLQKMGRNHIHCSNGIPQQDKVTSGARKDCNVFIILDLETAIADGIEFYRSKNDVILTSGKDGTIEPKYFKEVRINGEIVFRDGAALKQALPFEYFMVLDFEATCQEEKTKDYVNEIIEFPVVVISAESLETVATFHHYIKPTQKPLLTAFCTDLTGIKQETVDKGIILQEALEELHTFLVDNKLLDKSWTFVTCGDWDLRSCLKREAQTKDLELRQYMTGYINIKSLYQQVFGHRAGGMPQMLTACGLSLDGRHHSGIDDSRNIAKILVHLLNNGLKVNRYDETRVAYAKRKLILPSNHPSNGSVSGVAKGEEEGEEEKKSQ